LNIVSFSLRNLGRRKMRTGLAVLGIALGVMLITSLLAVMDGLESSVTESLGLLSGNLIIQQRGAVDQALSTVNVSLVDYLSGDPDVEVVSPEIYVPRSLPGGGMPRFINLIGITNSYRQIVPPGYMKAGTSFDESDRGKAVLGAKLAGRLGLGVGGTLAVDPINFTVTGIFETNTFVDSLIVLVPLADARGLSGKPEGLVSVVEVRPVSPERARAIKERVESEFEEYEAVFPEDLMREATEIVDTLRDVVWIVSSIAVLIGGVGIANAMLMSVMERTPEIGLMKAVGWRNVDVGYSVLLEALGMGIIGGLIGLLLGVSASMAAEGVVPALSVRFTSTSLAESFLFAIALSMGSGVYPAARAARLSPMVAIRGE